MEFGKGPSFGDGMAFGSGPKFGADVPDPLAGVEYTGNLEHDMGADLAAMDTAYRDRAAREEARREDATDSEFWVALAFATRDEKEAFLKEFKLSGLGDKYLDGRAVARLLRKHNTEGID
jgi:hypothetical protein